MSKQYENYRRTMIETGQAYQDFVVDACWTLLGLAVVQYSSKLYQQTVGESRTGVEIKNDRKFQSTGNLWIELAEKARPRNGDYAQSGINRDDNTWLYCIGDYDTIFIFQKNLLKMLAQRYGQRENHTATSVGYLLPVADAEKYAAAILRPNAATKISSAIHDMEALGRVLHQLARTPSNQLSLLAELDVAA